MRGTLRCIGRLALGDTAFAVMVLATVLFALAFQWLVAPSPDLTAGLIALFVSTAAVECWNDAAIPRRSDEQRVRPPQNTRL